MNTYTRKALTHGISGRLENIIRHYRLHVVGASPKVSHEFKHQVPNSVGIRSLAIWYDEQAIRPSEVGRRKVADAYSAFKRQLGFQLRLLRSFGYTFEIVDEDPFETAEEMIDHVRETQHLPVMSTDVAIPNDHPLNSQSGFTDVHGTPMLHNGVFRGVHDVLGHVFLGADFAPFTLTGEWRTFNAHSQMFTGNAVGVLATEAMAQVAWMDSAPRFDGDDRAIGNREFPDQKIAVVPEVLRDEVAA